MARFDDLTILLTLKDKTKQGFDSVGKRMKGLQGRAEKLKVAVNVGAKAIGGALVAAFGSALFHGTELFNQLDRMGALLGQNTQEANALLESFREGNARVEIDGLSDGLLTLKERFSEARVETGELFNFVKDFGLQADFSISGTNAQTLEFLNVLKQLPDAGDRATTAIAIMGDTGAEQFIPMLQNMEDLNALYERLAGNIEDTPNFFSAGKIKAVDDYRGSVGELKRAWDTFAKETAALFAPALEYINDLLARFVGWATKGVRALGDFFGVFDANAIIPSSTVEGLADQLDTVRGRLAITEQEYVEVLKKLETVNVLAAGGLRTEASELEQDIDQFQSQIVLLETSLKNLRNVTSEGNGGNNILGGDSDKGDKLRKEIEAALKQKPIKLTEFEVVDLNEQFRVDLKAANDERDPKLEASKFRAEQFAREKEAIDNLSTALSGAGNAFGEFANLAAGKSESAFKTFKRIEIAFATVAAFSAATKSLAEANGNPFLRLAAYAQILSVGLGAVSQMRSVNVGSGGAGAGSAPSVSTPQVGAIGGTAQQSQSDSTRGNKTTIVLEGRDKTYDSDDIENIVEGLKIAGLDVELLAA